MSSIPAPGIVLLTLCIAQILEDMIVELDTDADGCLTLDEWRYAALINVPLLVLLGFDEVVFLLMRSPIIPRSQVVFHCSKFFAPTAS